MSYFYLDDRGYCVYERNRDRTFLHAHRVEMERRLGRPLLSSENVHHMDERRWNNCPFNLELQTRSQHMKLHRGGWVVKRGWACDHERTPENTIQQWSGTMCRICNNAYKRRWRARKRLEAQNG